MSLGNFGAAPTGGQPTGEHGYEEATIEEIDTEEVETTSDVKVEIVEQNEEPEIASVFVGKNLGLFFELIKDQNNLNRFFNHNVFQKVRILLRKMTTPACFTLLKWPKSAKLSLKMKSKPK